ncbi:DJ-1/PfpI family protein [Clostridium cellulovorans]|uniref:ThiJ/PfpI domain-containing protein n=1 Tax=Clostridium cellulovorans (strain ATCC 35296 / DSM 3052 / OCM 3 / 743B) TaxID=573061 RepID=D9SQF2_CLOC7|nr:DJ-1/PfpI family protein [Clostridium cellulovorans]ADL50219.1 ThiJ/PfpI domain-containing protein [Clostridium cellulovorans 743B]
MSKKILIIASNLGLWGEELQAPWDALKNAGHEVTLATMTGKTPLPLVISMDDTFIDPMQGYNVNPKFVVDRIKKILETGQWNNPIKIEDAKMEDYDAIALVGGPGSPFDIVGNNDVHKLLLEAYKSNKIIGALCYVVGALVLTRDPDNEKKSIIYGRKVTAHPAAWDIYSPLKYPLYGASPKNPGTDITTPGFVYQLQPLVEDAVGPNGQVFSDPRTNRENPLCIYDHPFVTALSVESSIAYGNRLVEVLGSL